MNPAYLHLLINHVPVILAPLGFVAALLALVTRRRTVWLYALATLTLAGISAYPVMATGDSAEDYVKEHVVNVDRKAIESHGDSGDTTMWILIVGGVLAAYGWWRLSRPEALPLPMWLAALILVTGLFSTIGVTITSLKGGEIMHKEAHLPPGTHPINASRAPQPAD